MASNKVIQMPEPKGLSPSDRTRWLLRNKPGLLDDVAFQRWYAEGDLTNQITARQAWEALPPERRADFHAATMAGLERYWAMTPEEKAQENRKALCRTINKNDAAFTDAAREKERIAMSKLGFATTPTEGTRDG